MTPILLDHDTDVCMPMHMCAHVRMCMHMCADVCIRVHMYVYVAAFSVIFHGQIGKRPTIPHYPQPKVQLEKISWIRARYLNTRYLLQVSGTCS